MSMYDPEPKFQPKVRPRVQPKAVIPSFIGESGQVGNWLFYNGAGDRLYDFSGERNHGDINGPKWADENLATWALSFDGEDDYVDLGSPAELTFDGTITILAWAKTTATSFQWLYNLNSNDDPAIFFRMEDTGELKTEIDDPGGAGPAVISTQTINDGSWHFLAFSADNTDTMEQYIDGENTGSDDATTADAWTTAYPCGIGYRTDGAYYWDGE